MAKTYNGPFSDVTTGSVYTAAAHNDVLENLNNYRVPPMCVVQRKSSDQSIASLAIAVVNWDTETVDTDGMFSATSTDVTIQTPGLYQINLCVLFQPNNTGQRIVWITKNSTTSGSGDSTTLTLGSTAIAAAGSDASQGANDYKSCGCIVPLAANDVIRGAAYQSSGGALNVGNSASVANVTAMSLMWLGQAS